MQNNLPAAQKQQLKKLAYAFLNKDEKQHFLGLLGVDTAELSGLLLDLLKEEFPAATIISEAAGKNTTEVLQSLQSYNNLPQPVILDWYNLPSLLHEATIQGLMYHRDTIVRQKNQDRKSVV